MAMFLAWMAGAAVAIITVEADTKVLVFQDKDTMEETTVTTAAAQVETLRRLVAAVQVRLVEMVQTAVVVELAAMAQQIQFLVHR